MATLEITRTGILRYVGRFLGISRDSADWTTDQDNDVDDAISSGERQFYQPPIPHAWSFLKPVMVLPLVAGTGEYDLPDDFGGFVDPKLSFTSDSNAVLSVMLTSVSKILTYRQRTNFANTTQALYAAVSPLPQTGQSEGQRYQLLVHPEGSGILNGRYYSYPYGISSSTPYPLGGQPHAETLLESCLAAAELQMNDMRGPHHERFMELLAASIELDRRQTGTKLYGYNGNWTYRDDPRNNHVGEYVSYGGVLYTGS